MGDLAPVPYAVGINAHFCNHQGTVGLRMTPGLFRRPAQYTVVDMHDNPVFNCSLQAQKSGNIGGATYQVYSLSQRKGFIELQDSNGNVVLLLENEWLHWNRTYVGKDPKTDETIFTIKAKMFSMSGENVCTFRNASNGEEIELISRGKWFERSAEITLGRDGPVVARVAGHWSTLRGEDWTVNLGPHEYSLAIAPGVDIALITAMAMCIDDQDKTQNSST